MSEEMKKVEQGSITPEERTLGLVCVLLLRLLPLLRLLLLPRLLLRLPLRLLCKPLQDSLSVCLCCYKHNLVYIPFNSLQSLDNHPLLVWWC